MTKKLPYWTVLLLRPDYMAGNYGQDTYLAHVKATSAEDAIEAARLQVSNEDGAEMDQEEDYYPLMTLKGKHDDITPARCL